MTLTENYKTEMCSYFYEIWHLEQIEHANYEYRIYLELIILTQNYGFRQICSQNCNVCNVYKFWHSGLLEYVNFYKFWIWNSKLDPKF